MATSSRSAERFKYGICLNDECTLCKEKKVQQIPMRKDLVCSECGKPLRECPPPPTGPNKKLIGIIAGAIVGVAAIGGGIYALTSGGEKVDVGETEGVKPPVKVQVQDTVRKDTVSATFDNTAEKAEPKDNSTATTPKKPQPEKPLNGYGTVNLGYGTYTGDLKNGKPHGHGTITYRSTHTITGSYQANPGDKYEGDFRDGRVSGGLGYWTHDGNVTTINP